MCFSFLIEKGISSALALKNLAERIQRKDLRQSALHVCFSSIVPSLSSSNRHAIKHANLLLLLVENLLEVVNDRNYFEEILSSVCNKIALG